MNEVQIKRNIMTNVILVILGVFIATTIFTLGLKLFSDSVYIAVFSGLTVNIALAILAFHYTPKKSPSYFVAWGIIGTIILSTILYFLLLSMITSSFEGF